MKHLNVLLKLSSVCVYMYIQKWLFTFKLIKISKVQDSSVIVAICSVFNIHGWLVAIIFDSTDIEDFHYPLLLENSIE